MRWIIKILKIPRAILKFILLLPVFFYQKLLSPLLPTVCRFTPSCSQFMVEAIKKKGPIWGLILGIYRIIRCNPFNPGGYDPVDRWPPYWDGKKWRWRLKTIENKDENNSNTENKKIESKDKEKIETEN